METKIPLDVKSEMVGLPMTTPMYYENSYRREFEGRVLKLAAFGEKCFVVMDQSCFFPEGGGQLGDTGFLTGPSGKLKVVDTQTMEGLIVHLAVSISGKIREGESVHGLIDWSVRHDRMRQHTCSHVLFSAIKKVLGLDSLTYRGVQINENASRIDINYGKPISVSQLQEMERLSSTACLQNRSVKTWFSTRDEAERIYGKQLGMTEVTPSGVVRVVEVEDWDVALCCGTHVSSTAEIGLVKALGRSRLQKGVERIRFTVGERAYRYYAASMQTLGGLAQRFRSSAEEVATRVDLLLEEKEHLKKELEKTRNQLTEQRASKLLSEKESVGEFKLLRREVPGVDAQSLRTMAIMLTDKDPRLIVVLGSAKEKACIIGVAGQKAVERGIDMAKTIKETAKVIRGDGGGTARIAQAGGRDSSRLEEALRLYADDVVARMKSLHR